MFLILTDLREDGETRRLPKTRRRDSLTRSNRDTHISLSLAQQVTMATGRVQVVQGAAAGEGGREGQTAGRAPAQSLIGGGRVGQEWCGAPELDDIPGSLEELLDPVIPGAVEPTEHHDDGWEQIDSVGAWDACLSEFTVLEFVPPQHKEVWGWAYGEILRRIQGAVGKELERGLKFLAMATQLFARPRATAAVAEEMWPEGSTASPSSRTGVPC